MLVKFEFHAKISVLSTSVTSENWVTVGRDSNGVGGGVIYVNGSLCFFCISERGVAQFLREAKKVWYLFLGFRHCEENVLGNGTLLAGFTQPVE